MQVFLRRSLLGKALIAVAYNRQAHEELETRTTDFRPRVRTLNSLGYAVVSRAVGATPITAGTPIPC